MVMESTKDNENQSNIRTFNTVSKLVQTISTKLREQNLAMKYQDEILISKHVPEFRELKNLCSDDDPVLRLTACQGIVSLVQSNLVTLKYAFIVLDSIFVYGKNMRGISLAVLDLLVLDLRLQLQNENSYKNPLPSYKCHPICKLLDQNPSSWREVLNEIVSICYHHNEIVASHAVELLRPIFTFILLDSTTEFSENFRFKTWELLVDKGVGSEKDLIFQILAGKYFDCKYTDPLEVISHLSVLCKASLEDTEMRNALIPLMVSLVDDAVKSCYDPSPALSELKLLLDCPDNCADTVVLIMLSHVITFCPAGFLHQILVFCEWLVSKGQCSADSIWMLVVASLSWLNCVSPLLTAAHRSIHNILAVAQTAVSAPNRTHILIKNKFLPYVVSRNNKITEVIQLASLCESLRSDESKATLNWLSKIPADMINKVYLYIGALMIGRRESEIRLKAIDIIAGVVPSFASYNLTLILYQLGCEKEPICQLALLRALTATATEKSNISSVIFTLKTLEKSNAPHLQILAVDLFLRLWDVEERCYPLLSTVLTQDNFNNSECSSEMNIACAAGFRHICEKMPEKHGKELVKPIQNLLINCQNTKGITAVSFLIQALASLVKARVLSASSTWNQLLPLTEDMHSVLSVSFCELTEACVQQTCNDDVINSMCGWLWKLVSSSDEGFIINAALKALKYFNVENMRLRLVPAIYKEGLQLSGECADTSVAVDSIPEDNLTYVPGLVWVEFLQNVKTECQKSACELLAYWLEMELLKYRGIYNIQFQEPQNYDKLAEHSIVRGLVTHLRKQSSSVAESKTELLKLIFQVLCIDRRKPLPPVNWGFLMKFFLHEDLKEHAVALAAKESRCSPTAKGCVENYINCGSHTEEKDLFLCSLLTDLTKGISAETLQNLIGRTLRSSFTRNDVKLVKQYLLHIRVALKDKSDISDASRTVLSQNIKAIWEDVALDSPLIDEILETAVNLPVTQLEAMSSVTVMWEITSEKLKKVIKLRCKMASTERLENPFAWLNECIEATQSRISEQSMLLDEIEKVLNIQFGHKTTWSWIEELTAKMLQIACNKEPGLDFMFSIYVLVVDHVSKCSILFSNRSLEETYFRFPYAFSMHLQREQADFEKIKQEMKYLLKMGDLNETNTSLIKHGLTAIM